MQTKPTSESAAQHFGDSSLDALSCDLCAKVREVAIEAIERARRGDGPTLIEAQTYRFRGHSLADPDELREKKEKDYWQVLSLHHLSCLYASLKWMQLNA